MQEKIKDQLLPTNQRVIFGIENYFEKDDGKEQRRITKRNFFYIITDKYNNTCLHMKIYNLTNKNLRILQRKTVHAYMWKPISISIIFASKYLFE